MPANIYKNKDGKRIPGVTTVIGSNLGWNKQALMAWANQMGLDGKYHYDVSDEAATTGTIAHKMVELELKGEKFDWPNLGQNMGASPEQIKQAENAFEQFIEWRELVKFELLFSEHLLVSENYQYGGQIDIAAVQGKTAIVDLKTSNEIYADHRIQISAYDNLWLENHAENPAERHYILRLGKEGGFAYHSLSEPEIRNGFRAFVLLRELHDLKKVI